MSNTSYERLRQYQLSENLTWKQVGERLGVGVSMLMMVKRGERNLSEKALYRLEQLERDVASRKSRAQRVVEGILSDEGSAAQLLQTELRGAAKLELPVEYANPRTARSLPKQLTLLKPPEARCAKLRQLFAETLDTTVILLSCLPEPVRSEKFLNALLADSRIRLTNGALGLVIPDWRGLVANTVPEAKRGN